MLSTQQFENCSSFSQELELKQLVQSNRVSIIYIHGTARSGSTIAEIVLSQLADLAIHQPFRGVLQQAGEHFRIAKLNLNVDIYNSGCGLIVKQIKKYLQKLSGPLLDRIDLHVGVYPHAHVCHDYIGDEKWSSKTMKKNIEKIIQKTTQHLLLD
mgnify:CR=1 FL=1